MAETVEFLRPYAEFLFFVAGILLCIVAAIGLQQIGLVKEDIRTRNTRAAREKAIEAASSYLREFIPQYNQLSRQITKLKIPGYNGPVGDFDFNAWEPGRQAAAAKRFEPMIELNFADVFNTMEGLAAYFTTGVADEPTGFRIIGRTFCATVASNYDLLALCYSDKVCPYYQNIVQLYRTWGARLNKEELRVNRSELDKKIAKMTEASLDHIQPRV